MLQKLKLIAIAPWAEGEKKKEHTKATTVSRVRNAGKAKAIQEEFVKLSMYQRDERFIDRSFICSFVHSFIHLLIHSFPHSSTHSLANLRLRVRLVRNLVGKKVADSCRDAGGVNAIDSDLEKRERKRETLNCVIRVFVSLCSVLFCSGVSCVFSASLSLPGSPFCKTQTAASARSGST